MGSLVSAPEECWCTGLPLGQGREDGERTSPGAIKFPTTALVFVPAKLTTRQSVVWDLGLPPLGKNLGHGIQR